MTPDVPASSHGTTSTVILRAEGLTRNYARGRIGLPGIRATGTIEAVRGVDLEVRAGETLALVGGSGSGKSTTARLLLGLESPEDGRVLWRGRDIAALDRESRLEFRRSVQVVFQDPFGSLNPRQSVGEMLREALKFHGLATGAAAEMRVSELLELAGLAPAMSRRYPHEFSGGQRQRVAIARALSVEPDLIVADEPVSALDVSVRAQILNLFLDLRTQPGLSLLLIAHDLSVVRHVADRTAVMSDGRIVECGPTRNLFDAPLHPATRGLLASMPPPLRRFP
jgi:ABC-type glutathione transport system ATPase component